MSISGREETSAEAFDVVATIGNGKKHIVISTPSSGWFRCGGERGPGIALWLGLAGWASHRDSNARYTFIATSAHELGQQGMRHILGSESLRPKHVDAWLHLGSSIAAHGTERRLMTNRKEWLPGLARQFGSFNGLKPEVTDKPGGELSQLAALGYGCFGILGGHTLSHSPGDNAQATSAELLGPVGEALLRTLAEIESSL